MPLEYVVKARILLAEKSRSSHDGHALYFSRSPLPFNRMDADIVYDKHVGIYCYPKAILQAFVGLAPSYLEQAEGLEQLRLLENGYPIKVVKTNYEAVGVDTDGDAAFFYSKRGPLFQLLCSGHPHL